MKRFFNTAGPCLPDSHYMLPPERRIADVRHLIERALFFVIHAPRQTGKTTLLNTLGRALNAEGRYAAVVCSVEHLRREKDAHEGNRALIRVLHADSREQLPLEEQGPATAPFEEDPHSALNRYLGAWAAACPKPIVLLIDEIDSIAEDFLLSVLSQLRRGYTARPLPFVHSLALVGVRDVRGYRIRLRPEHESMGSASPFNVKSDSLVLRNFTRDDIAELYAQHTAETGQSFTPEAVDRAFAETQGQPWLVNALAQRCVEHVAPDPAEAITAAHVQAAREALIERRDTHLDSLVDKLREERVRRVIEPILAGTTIAPDIYNDDLVYVRDLGLITTAPTVRIANPIYQEIIPRSLSWVMQVNIAQEASWFAREDGSLDMRALLRSFQEFFAEHSEGWLARYDYQEAGPHLILMAFLQRVVNGGGQIQREMAVGSGRVDLCVTWRGQRYALELKVRRGEKTLGQGVEQLSRYLARLGLEEGYLVLFDRRVGVGWEEKLYEKEVEGKEGKRIVVFGA